MRTVEVVAAVIYDAEGRIFATQRGYGEWKDWWEFPGGKMEAGETPQQALKREIREELDAEIEVGDLMRTIDYDYPDFHLTMHCFRCRLTGSVTLKEHEAAKWLAPNALQTVRWLPADEDFIRELDATGENMTIIFDLDGTLLNTIDDLGYACNHALAQTGYPTHPIEAYPAKVGNGINNLIRRALPENERTEENILRVRAHFVPYYDAHNCDYTRPYEGIPQLLAALKAQGHRLAVASNKYQAATEKIVSHFFPGVFDVILGEREGVERKPNPQIVYDILDRLTGHIPAEPGRTRTLYVGDSLVDYETAKNAGVPFIACSWGFVPLEKLVEAGITAIVNKPEEILNHPLNFPVTNL